MIIVIFFCPLSYVLGQANDFIINLHNPYLVINVRITKIIEDLFNS